LFDRPKNRLYVIAGGAGSGKTVYLLSGVENGLELFSTESVHFTFVGGHFIWFMGSLVDNVRVETLRLHFPHFLSPSLSMSPDIPWLGKVALDLSPYRCREEILCDPEIVILLPRIEEGRRSFELNPLESPSRAVHALFDNIGEKLAETVLLYDILPVPGLDTANLATARRQAVEKLVGSEKTWLVASVLSRPGLCWGDILSNSARKRRRK